MTIVTTILRHQALHPCDLRRHVDTDRPPPPPRAERERDYEPEQVGHSLYDSLKILGLGLGASEREDKLAYRRLACLYHPDKWDQTKEMTGLTLLETTAHFQLLNNAQSFLRATL
jgi:hypothetical protein